MAVYPIWHRPAQSSERGVGGRILKSQSAGFSLIELLVVTAIIVIISSVVFVNNARFGGVVKLENFAYDVALSIRQAQVYGISVARFKQPTFTAGYGVRFNLANPTTYIMFADALTKHGLYDCPGPSADNCELVQTSSMTGGYAVSDICVTPAGGAENCSVTTLDVFFIRPDPDALISADGTSCLLSPGACQLSARIQLRSPRGETMNVVVEASGQISVQRVSN